MQKDIISAIHSDIRQARLTRRGATVAPEDAARGGYKEYPRMPLHILPESSLPDISLRDVLKKRMSHKKDGLAVSLSMETLAALLSTVRTKVDGTRPYPSGGALYPIETYLIGSVDEYTKQVFHYHPKIHALEDLWAIPEKCNIPKIFPQKQIEGRGEPSAILVFTSVWDRSARKYGDFAYNLALLEAGHMAQNILLAAAALGLGAAPFGGFDDSMVQDMLDLGNNEEQAVYIIAVF